MWISWSKEGKKLERVHRVALNLTRSQFPGGGGLEVSLLCHKKLCVNLTVVEARAPTWRGYTAATRDFDVGHRLPITFSN